MGLALGVVVLHVVEAGELGLGDDGVALRAGVVLGGADGQAEDVRLAILYMRYTYQSSIRAADLGSQGIGQCAYLLVVRGQLTVLIEDDLLLLWLGDLEESDTVDAVGHCCGCGVESGERREEASSGDAAREHSGR